MTMTAPPREAQPPAAVLSDRRALLEALYLSAETGYHFAVWTHPDYLVRFFTADAAGIDSALLWIDGTLDDGKRNIFCSMYLVGRAPREGRGTAADAQAIVALWADLDYKGPGHNGNTNYPDSEAEAIEIARAMPIRPSALIHSGGGIHAYWFFPEPLYLETEDDRADVLDLLARWKATVQHHARAAGRETDAVFDAARVMRIPGTLNVKTNPPVRARILEIDRRLTYGALDIEPVLQDLPGTWTGDAQPVDMSGIRVEGSDDIPEPFAMLMAHEVKARLTWERNRSDLRDQSASAYCLAVANYAVQVGLTDQEVVSLLCLWRQMHGARPKGPSWYALTIGKARRDTGMKSSDAEFLATATEAPDEATPPVDRAELLRGLSELLEFPIEDLVVINGEKVTVRLKSGGVDRAIGSPEVILSQGLFRKAVSNWLHNLKIFKDEPWRKIVDLLFEAAEIIDPPSEETEGGQVLGWIRDLIVTRGIAEGVKPAKAFWDRSLFRDHDGEVWVFGEHILDYLHTSKKWGKVPTIGALNQALRQAGCRYGTSQIGPRGKNVNHTRWRVPTHIVQAGLEERD